MSKKILRKKFISLRKKNFKKIKFNSLKLKYIFRKFKIRKTINIGVYYPINSEIDCLEIFKNFKNDRFRLSLPVISRNNSMDFYIWSFNDPLIINEKGIPEPYKKLKVYPDVMIVPLVAFDKNKFRLGYGGGYYDRYINSISKIKKIFKIGFAFSFQEILKLPVDKYDQKLDAILTDKKIII